MGGFKSLKEYFVNIVHESEQFVKSIEKIVSKRSN